MKKVILTITIECTNEAYNESVSSWANELKEQLNSSENFIEEQFGKGVNSINIDSTVIDE